MNAYVLYENRYVGSILLRDGATQFSRNTLFKMEMNVMHDSHGESCNSDDFPSCMCWDKTLNNMCGR
jgi:hypothetical protein